MPRGTLTSLLAAALLAAALPASAAEEAGFPDAAQRAAEFASFCQFVDEEYAYFDARKTEWPKACAHYAAQAADATDRSAYVSLLERALAELYDAHAHLGTNTPQSPRLVPTQSSLFGAWRAGKAVIVAVKQGSAAEQAGLRPGIDVLTVDGEPIEAAVKRIEPQFLSQADPVARDWALQIALAGHRDRRTVRLDVRVDGAARAFEFVAEAPQPTALLSHRSVGRVGHVRVHNSLGDPALVQAFDAALAAMPDARALVLDLRDTPSGGTSSVARGLMSRFVRRPMPYQRHELVSEFRSHGVRRIWVEYVAPRHAVSAPGRRARRSLDRQHGRRHRDRFERGARCAGARLAHGTPAGCTRRNGAAALENRGAGARRKTVPRRWHGTRGLRAGRDRGQRRHDQRRS